MTGPKFFETGMGHRFYEGTVPRLIEAIEGLAEAQNRDHKVELVDLTFMNGMDNTTLKEELIKRVQLIEQLRGHRDALLDQLAINHPPSPDTVLCEDSQDGNLR
tara:strand:+ start:163 stop:474 length:312 start_codon:yes stop_codon:yes gene_type:complete